MLRWRKQPGGARAASTKAPGWGGRVCIHTSTRIFPLGWCVPARWCRKLKADPVGHTRQEAGAPHVDVVQEQVFDVGIGRLEARVTGVKEFLARGHERSKSSAQLVARCELSWGQTLERDVTIRPHPYGGDVRLRTLELVADVTGRGVVGESLGRH